MAKYTLTMTEDQAYAVMYALEAYSRACTGQFDMLLNSCGDKFSMDGGYRYTTDTHLKGIVFPELPSNASYGILQASHVAPSARTAWDAYQYLRREIAWHRQGKDWRKDPRDWTQMTGVCYDPPFHASDNGKFETSVKEDP